ncbi:MAG: AraC family transcriptional regulator [Cyanobacteria bacterium P01_C01_bin.72]
MVNSASSTSDEIPSPIITSSDLGWQSITVAEFKQPPGDSNFTPDLEHTIALCLATKPYRIWQAIGDRNYSGIYSKGDISLAPAKLPCSYKVYGDDHYLEIKIPTSLLEQIAIEALNIDLDCLELRTEFRDRHPQIEQLAMMLRDELYRGQNGAGQLYIDSLANALVVNVLRDYSVTQPQIAVYPGGLSDRQLIRVIEFIQDNLDRSIKLEDLATHLGISKFHFSRLFKKSLGISPHQYVMQQRIELAQELLSKSNLLISDIALECGFSSHAHLDKYFCNFVGMTPTAYRQLI